MNLNACVGCLSVNRSLKTVNENERKLFYIFINTNFSKDQFELCWECRAMLKKFLRFRLQVRQAKDVLDCYVAQHTILNSLSSLQTTQCKYEIVCGVDCTQETPSLASVKTEVDEDVLQDFTAENLVDDDGDDKEALINASYSLHTETDLKMDTIENGTIENEKTEDVFGCSDDEPLQAIKVDKRKSNFKIRRSSNATTDDSNDESDIDGATSVVNKSENIFKQNQLLHCTILKSLSSPQTTECKNKLVCSVECEERENPSLNFVKIEDVKDFVEDFSAGNFVNDDDNNKGLMINASQSLNTETDLKMDTHDNEIIENENNTEDLFDSSDDEPLNIIKQKKRTSKAKRRVSSSETTDDLDSESDLEGATSVISKTDRTNFKQNQQVSFEIDDGIFEKPSENKYTEDLLDEKRKENENKLIKQMDYCFFCKTLVLNFSRHIVRNHSIEPEVQKILSMPKKSNCRRRVIAILRKKGNYIINNTQKSLFKPMKRSKYKISEDYLPCTKCLGFYARKQLWIHKKLCGNAGPIPNVYVDAQNFLLRHMNVSKKLKDYVLPHMRPDNISMYAKQDSLICAFGSQFFRTHREKHFMNETCRKMRELGELLIEIKKINPEINSLLDVLKPDYYGTLILATKNVASFNSKDRYKSPTYAMDIATSLKQCCNIALQESYKAQSCINIKEIQIDLETLTSIIQCNWEFDVSIEAGVDLNLKRCDKITVVELATDLKLLKDHLTETATHAGAVLKESSNSLNYNSYNELLESIFCRILLLNRRRAGELQRLKLSYYKNYDGKDSKNNKYKDFDKVLTPTEKILVNSLKRIVIRGKTGEEIPVLLSSDVQKDLENLISVRNKHVVKDNDFLFSKAGGSVICDYKTLEKYAKTCGANNPKALALNRFRKHLATLTQLFYMSDNDVEQLASFMNHTMSIRGHNFRVTDDLLQTAKISKLLLLMETGNADMYKGLNLDDIDINLDEEIIIDKVQNEEIPDFEMLDFTPVTETPSSNTSMEKKVIKKKRVLVPWTSQQKDVALKFFSKNIKSRKPPKRHECEKLRSQYPDLLGNKDWLKIKVFIQNVYTKRCVD